MAFWPSATENGQRQLSLAQFRMPILYIFILYTSRCHSWDQLGDQLLHQKSSQPVLLFRVLINVSSTSTQVLLQQASEQGSTAKRNIYSQAATVGVRWLPPPHTSPSPPQKNTRRICINLMNGLRQKCGGHVHPSPPRGDAPGQLSSSTWWNFTAAPAHTPRSASTGSTIQLLADICLKDIHRQNVR